MKKGLLTIGMTALAAVTLVGCSSGSSDSDVETITFINHKTDWETNGKWDEYIAKFNEKYPDIKVEVQTITDYAGQMKTRMNSKEYGDVLMIPGDISPKDYENFFEPLGDTEELSEKYLGLNDRSYEGVQYGIPSQMNATGLVVNKKVFEDAGITEFPKTTEDFMVALKKIKENDSSIVPLYTNYAAGWTLSNWDFTRTGVSGDADFTNEMTTDSSPFDEGDTMYTIYNTLYTVAKEGLIESDPTTSDWEQSKVDLANGKVAVMVLGSWAVPQVQEANEDNADNITFEVFPVTASDGKQYMPIGGDYNYGININSKHKKAARKFIDWMVNESDYAVDNGGIPTVKGAEYLKALQDSQDAGVELIEKNPAPEGKESLFSDINNESELGIGSTDTEKQRIIDAAIGNSKESFDDIMKDFNIKWANAIKAVSDN
ncbi:ABC transporter substrate-binding protein [Streptococcus macedonicus]|uniref:Extracellular solute-binding protein n=1 Tax=Streptococcus gallolyticus TaxID=315405 RepID=A0A380K3S9_9STRE|nr:ABC transporter substrate-binding protein [Streptococcus macedonicus]WGK79482.1 ABC transporter substrate-binding protein [Streptococcus macedonicus]SUN59220.1 extracellular solute-binding protein [Streptococcus gallolyticus]